MTTFVPLAIGHITTMIMMTSDPNALPSPIMVENNNAVPPNIVEMIETVIFSLEEDNSAMVSRTEEGHVWKFKYGTVEVFVQLTGQTDEDTFSVWSSVLDLPAKNESELMRKLLEMNWADTFEARFCILGGKIVVSTTRVVAELSPGEISRHITVVATIANEQDELLQAEFGQA